MSKMRMKDWENWILNQIHFEVTIIWTVDTLSLNSLYLIIYFLDELLSDYRLFLKILTY